MKNQFNKLIIFLSLKKKIVIIFLFAVLIRVCIATLHLMNLIPHTLNDTPINRLFLFTLEPYADYRAWYQIQVYNLLYTKWLPYSSEFVFPEFTATTIEEIIQYMLVVFKELRTFNFYYPPLFLYTLSLPSLISIELAFLPLFIADLLLPIVIYKFLVNQRGKKVAEWGFIATALCPLLILYTGGLFLNTSLVTLFFIITLYFIVIERFKMASFMIAISFLFKQTILFYFLPIIFYNIFQSCNKKKAESLCQYFKEFLIHISIVAGVLFCGSLPWIFINLKYYLLSLNVGQNPTLSPEFNPLFINSPMHWYDFLINLNAPYWLLYILGFPNFTSLGIILVEIFGFVLIIYWHRKKTLNWLKLLDILVITALLTHLFFLRGVYKYYFTFHIPLIVLWATFHYGESLSKNKSLRKNGGIIFILVSFAILLVPRDFYLIIIWIILALIIVKTIGFYKNEKLIE